jgi:hypothetical protein
MRTVTVQRRLPPRARSAGRTAALSRSITLGSARPARAHVWGKQAERSEAVGGSPYNRYSYAAGNPLRYTDPTGYFSAAQAFTTGLGIVLGVTDIAVCATGVGCAAVVAINAVFLTTSSVVIFNQPALPAVFIAVIGFAAGSAFGPLGAEAGAGLAGNGALGAVVGGAISGAASAAFMTVATGGNLGINMLTGAAYGAFGGALAVAFQQANPVSQAEARFFARAPDGSGGAPGDIDELGQDGRPGSGSGPRQPAPGRFLTSAEKGLYRLNAEGLKRLEVLRNFHYDFRKLRFTFSQLPEGVGGEAHGDLIVLDTQWDTPLFSQDDQVGTLAHESTHSVQFDRLGTMRAILRQGWENLAAEASGVSAYHQPAELMNMSVHTLNPVDSRFTLESIAEKAGDAAMGYGE